MRKCFICLIVLSTTVLNNLSAQKFESFTLSSSNCGKITSSTGSIIYIEDQAFDASSDSVSILYREIRTPAEMLANKLNMHMSLGGDRLQLVSTGMFEIYALDKSDTLPLLPDKRISVSMAIDTLPSTRQDAYYYHFDEESWMPTSSKVVNKALQNDTELWGSGTVEEPMEQWYDGFENFEFDFSDSVYLEQEAKRIAAFQQMEITSMGLHNYDYLLTDETYLYLAASFQKEDGASITSTAYVVYEDLNTVFSFPAYTWNEGFYLIKDRAYKLFAVDESGAVWYAIEKPACTAETVTFVLSPFGKPASLSTFNQLLATF